MSFKRLFLATLATFLFLGATAQADPGIADTITVVDQQVAQGDHFGVPIRIYNDEGLTGGTIGLRWNDPDLFLDSVSYVGGIFGHLPAFQKQAVIDNAINHEVLTGFFLFGGSPLPASSALWGTLWFTANAGAADKIVVIDSAKIQPAGDFILVDATNASFVPQYIKAEITIGNPSSNTPPVLAGIGAQNVAEGANLNFGISASDGESIAALSASTLANATFTDNLDGTGTFDFNPDFTQAGNYDVTFIASDGEFSDTEVVTITVTNTNRLPVWAAKAAESVDEGASLTFGVSASDADTDTDALTLTATNLPTNASFTQTGPTTGTFDFDPDFTQAGVDTVRFIVADAEGADTLDVQVTVDNVNRTPVLGAIAAQEVDEGANRNFLVSATDADGDDVSITAFDLPPNATFNQSIPNQGTFDFNPDFTQVGVYDVGFIAADVEGLDTITVQVTVKNVNRAPVLANIDPQVVDEGAILSLDVLASDADNDSLVLSATGLPANASFTDVGNGTGFLTYSPDYDQAGVDTVSFIVSDGTEADTIDVQITTNDGNRRPSLASVNDTTIQVGQNVIINISATDQDGDAITLTASAESNATFNDNGDGTGVFSFTPDAGQVGFINFKWYASDGDLADTVDATIDITAAPPELGSIAPDTLFFVITEGTKPLVSACALLTSTNAPSPYTGAVGSAGDPIFTTLLDSSGVTNDSVCVEIAAGALTPGMYYNTASFMIDGINNNPINLVTCLTVEAAAIPDSAFASVDTIYFSPGEVSDGSDNRFFALTSTNAPASYTSTVDLGSSPAFTTVSGSGITNDSVEVIVNVLGFSNGSYYNTVNLIVDGVVNNPVSVVICVAVSNDPPDTAVFLPDTLFFTATEGTDEIQVGCSFLHSSNSPAPYTYIDTSFVTFASAIDSAGLTGDSVCVSVNPGSVAVGVHYAELLYRVDSVVNNFIPLVVCLTVEPQIVIDTSAMAISDSMFQFISSVDTPFISGDSVLIYNVGSGPDFGWAITDIECMYSECVGNVIIDTFINPGDTFGCLDTIIPVPIGMDTSGITVSPLNGTTPMYAFINVDNQNLAPGTYTCWFNIEAAAGVENSPQSFHVEFIVRPAPPQPVSIMALSDSLFEHVAVAGEPNVIYDSLVITNIGDGPEFDWQVDFSNASCTYIPYCAAGTFCFDTMYFDGADLLGLGPVSGTTPSILNAAIATDTLPPGEYWCYFDVFALSSEVERSRQTVIAHLTILPAPVGPSTDTLFVSTVPATPGSKVKVPVNLINNGPVCQLDIPLQWASSQIFLDSVSFAGTRLDGISKTDYTVDNLARKVTITFDAVNIALPAGSGRIAYMYFDVFSGITEGGLVPIDRFDAVTSGDCVNGGLSPEFFSGGIVIDSSGNVICGRVVDTAGNEIPGATVQVWDNFPSGTFFAEDVTLLDGSFKFTELFVVPYTLYGYAEGYYPNTVEDINFGVLGLEVVLTPVSPVKPTNEWVEFYCENNTYKGVPLPIGSVIDAFDPDGDHVGTWFAAEAGAYGFMPIYRDDAFTEEDDGADPGDIITLYINGMPAEATGDRVWTQNGDRHEVCLNFDGSVNKEIFLRDGWNLISWNIDTEVDDVATLFGPIMDHIDVILSFEEVGLTYDPELTEFSTLTSADHLHGYWVRIETFLPRDTGHDGPGVTLSLDGLPALVNTPIHLEAGWNLVSYLPPVSLPTPSALVSQEGNLRVALGFNGGAQTYEPSLPDFSTLNTLAPCYGYWLKVFEPSTLVYPGFNSAPFIEQGEYIAADVLAKLGVANELAPTGSWIDIYASEMTLDGAAVNAGVEIRVVDANNQLVGYGQTASAGKLMFTPVYGATDKSDNGLATGESFSLLVDGKETNESFTFTQRGERLEIGALSLREGADDAALPTEFNLAQNYPNPFNPSTKITFSLPTASEVTIEVYNVLGARVATLISGAHQAGQGSVVWDAVNDAGLPVASGMYFYRLKAGSFTLTRKMVLLK